MKKHYSITLKVLSIIFITAILGEVNIVLFNSPFRFGLGSAAFFFLLLFYKDVPYLIVGILTGICTTLFRMLLSLPSDTVTLTDAMVQHSPIIGYYTMFSLVFYFAKPNRYYDLPLFLGVLGTITDSVSNIVELSIRSLILETSLFSIQSLNYVLIVAVLRSFFVVGLFNMIYTTRMKAVYTEQKQRFKENQLLTSNLFVEVFYLRKLLTEIEDVTAKSHLLYRELKKIEEVPNQVTQKALSISQEVHEVKKDNQRILAGLEKLIKQEKLISDISLPDIIELMIESNKKYTSLLGKNITFHYQIETDISVHKVYPLMIILNNLLANAVEAIEWNGIIEVNGFEKNGIIYIQVTDNGAGIYPGDEDIVFEPGFTTKYDEAGRPSTGIGLSHVKSMIRKLNGEISLNLEPSKTTFVIEIPSNILSRKE